MCATSCETHHLLGNLYRVQRFNALLRIYYIYAYEKTNCSIVIMKIEQIENKINEINQLNIEKNVELDKIINEKNELENEKNSKLDTIDKKAQEIKKCNMLLMKKLKNIK
jgi:hypothetical protein